MSQFIISGQALDALYQRIASLEELACSLQCCCCKPVHEGCTTYTYEEVLAPGSEQVQNKFYDFVNVDRALVPLSMVVTVGEPFAFDLNWILMATYANGSQQLIASGVITEGFTSSAKSLEGENSNQITDAAELSIFISAPNEDLNPCMGCGLSATLFAMHCPDVDTTDCEACVDIEPPPCRCSVFEYGTTGGDE